MVPTTTSLAISPVNRDTEFCHEANPSGINIGFINLPIVAKKLTFISTIPVLLKFDKNHTITEIEKIIVPAFFKKPLPFSQVCINKLLGSGNLYSGNSIIKGSSFFLNKS